MKTKALLSILTSCLLGATSTLWSTITIDSGAFDWTVFYNPQGSDFSDKGNDDAEWFFVARAKGTTIGNKNGVPLTTTGGNFTWSGSGGSTADYTYDILDVRVDDPISISRGGVDYWITPASGTSYTLSNNPTEVDTGIRTRLNDSGFTSIQFIFDTVASTLDGVSFADTGADFLLFRDELDGAVLVDTDNGIFSWTYPPPDVPEPELTSHTHYNFGFSQGGNYSLVFNVQGFDSDDNPMGIAGSGTINYNVVPEPQTYALFFGLVVLGWAFIRRIRR